VNKAIRAAGRVTNGALPAVEVARSVYTGPYEGLAQAWGELQQWVRDRKLGETGRFWERYLTNPSEVKDPKHYRTELNWIVSGK
jgi:effector-binding domain-containing protein